MFYLPLSCQAWNTVAFNNILKQEICSLETNLLPLQQGLQHSNYANGENLSATVLNVKESKNTINAKVGLFYSGIVAGCNCADDPTPVDENNEYCEVLFCIDKQTAKTTVVLID